MLRHAFRRIVVQLGKQKTRAVDEAFLGISKCRLSFRSVCKELLRGCTGWVRAGRIHRPRSRGTTVCMAVGYP